MRNRMKGKRILAVLMSAALFLNGWGNYGFTVAAEEEKDLSTQSGHPEPPDIRKSLSGKNITVSLEPESAVYTGEPIIPEVAVYDGEQLLSGDEYSVRFSGDLTDIGEYQIIITAAEGSEYQGENTSASFVIAYGTEEAYTLPSTLTEGIYPDTLVIMADTDYTAVSDGTVVSEQQVVIDKIDQTIPNVTLSHASNWDEAGQKYWKNAENLEIELSVSDAASGLTENSIELWCADEKIEDACVGSSLVIRNAGSYQLLVTDAAGNQAETTFVVAQDTGSLSLQIGTPTVEKENTYQDDELVWWTGNGKIQIPVQVMDESGEDDTEEAPYTVQYSTSQSFADAAVLEVVDAEAVLDIQNLSGTVTYYFQVSDLAGNKGITQSLTIACDTTDPQIIGTELLQLHGDAWINQEELGTARKVQFQVQAEDDQTDIRTIEYSLDNGENYQEAAFVQNGAVYTCTTAGACADGSSYAWKIRVTNQVGLSSEVAVADGKIDTIAPESEVYIRFLSDTKGENDQEDGEDTKNGWTSKIMQTAAHIWSKIWGKQTISYEIYIRDETSGVDSFVISYEEDGKEQKILSSELQKEEGLLALLPVDGTDTAKAGGEKGYEVYSGEITISEGATLAVKDFRISDLVDVAGNRCEDSILLKGRNDNEILYLDAAAPQLISVTALNTAVNEKEMYFYPDTVNVRLTIKERFFTDAEPTIRVYKKYSTDSAFPKDPETGYEKLTWYSDEKDIYYTDISLPKEDGLETEYRFTLDYADPSGNLLVNGDGWTGVSSEGRYESRIFVIDARSPELLSYTVNDATAYSFDGANVYLHDAKSDDLQVEFQLDENESYVDAEDAALLVEVYEKGETDTLIASNDPKTQAEQKLQLTRDHEDGTRIYMYSFGFDGRKTDPEAPYYVKIQYQDAAGLKLESGNEELAVEQGVYTSAAGIIDHVAPQIAISYSEGAHVVNGSGADLSAKVPTNGATAYYKDSITVSFELTEKYPAMDQEHFTFRVYKDGQEIQDAQEQIRWETQLKGTYVIDKGTDGSNDGDYEIQVEFQDAAGNLMVPGELLQDGTISDGKYTSAAIVLDTTAPVVSAAYESYGKTRSQSDPVQSYQGRVYFDQNVQLAIVVEDRNIRHQELTDVLKGSENTAGMQAFDITGAALQTTAKEELSKLLKNAGQVDHVSGTEEPVVWTVDLPLNTEANYDIPVAFTDLAGNVAEYGEVLKVCVDKTEPEEPSLTYSVGENIDYAIFGWHFSQVKVNVTAASKDMIAGIHQMQFTLLDESGKTVAGPYVKEMDPSAAGTYEVSIPVSGSDFKGTVLAEVEDWSTNHTELQKGNIVESTSRHTSTGNAAITTMTGASRRVAGEDYYNTDVQFRLSLKDSYSGLRSYSYTGGKTLSGSRDYAKEASKEKAITYEFAETMTLSASSNNENDVKVAAEYTDNTGHTGKVEQLYNIDITKPVITVEYDLNDPSNGRFYHQTRTATVTIQERNFDADDVDFTITNTDGTQPTIGGWSSSGSGDETKHVCEVTFAADGDYTFTLDFQDMAGNEAEYSRVDEFTIDQTKPVLNVTYDNTQSTNDYYYANGRTATIDILEHNFDPAFIEVSMTAEGAAVPSVSGWSRNGDHNVATVRFDADADYTFTISGVDQADNPLDAYETDHFVIDQTAPELEIFDIEPMSANNGVVAPGIRYSDTNYDANGTVIRLSGYHNGEQELTGNRSLISNGVEIHLEDFAHTQEMDDLYTMEAVVYDLAGNSSEANVTFSVNRFGSVYTFDSATEQLAGENGTYYTKEESNLVITETNVDSLQFREITCSWNGELRTLQEGTDYTVQESGSDVSWKQYTYTVDKKNFSEEGTYILSVYSEDRASNASDNRTKGKKLEFVVDKTSPSILISGVENDGQYRENSREVTLDVQDNILLSEVDVTVEEKTTTYTASELADMDGRIVFTIGNANYWQNMQVTARDAAGNEYTSGDIRFLITSNVLVQFYMNKVLFYGTTGGVVSVVWGAGWLIYLFRRRRK